LQLLPSVSTVQVKARGRAVLLSILVFPIGAAIAAPMQPTKLPWSALWKSGKLLQAGKGAQQVYELARDEGMRAHPLVRIAVRHAAPKLAVTSAQRGSVNDAARSLNALLELYKAGFIKEKTLAKAKERVAAVLIDNIRRETEKSDPFDKRRANVQRQFELLSQLGHSESPEVRQVIAEHIEDAKKIALAHVNNGDPANAARVQGHARRLALQAGQALDADNIEQRIAVALPPGAPQENTPEPIATGRRFKLHNSTTKRVEDAIVTDINHNTYNHLDFATVRFPDGGEQAVTLSRLRLVGKPLARQRSTLKQLRRIVVDAIGEHLDPALGAEAEKIPTRLKRTLGGDVVGLWDRDVHEIHLDRNTGAFDVQIRMHEAVHALSDPFYYEVRHKYGKAQAFPLIEGLTEYFSHYVAKRTTDIEPSPDHGYSDYLRFGEALARRVGHEQLKAIFFGRNNGLSSKLAAAVDGDRPGTLDRAMKLLGTGKPDKAIALIASFDAASPSTP
jgi:hypothetical protein